MAKKISSQDKAAAVSLDSYIERCLSLGLTAVYPPIVVSMMGSIQGWPVRDARGGADIAHFSTVEAAEAAVLAARRAARARGIDA